MKQSASLWKLHKTLEKKGYQKQPWLTQETLGNIKDRKEPKRTSGTHSNDYKVIAKEVKQMCRKEKEKFLTRKCRRSKI